METNAFASGSAEPSEAEVEFLGAASHPREFQTGEAKGPSKPSPFSTHYEKLQAAKAAKAAKESMAKASGSSRSSPYDAESIATKKNAAELAKVEGGEEKRADLPLGRRGLPNEVKEFIVENLACFQSHKTVIKLVSERYHINLDGRQLLIFDPTHRHCRMGKRLHLLYSETRKAYIERAADVAIAHQAHRLRLIGSVVEKAQNSKDYTAALKGLELAAKEMGGVLEGRSVVEHRGGVVHVHSSIEDARREVAMRLAQVVDGGLLLPSAPSVDVPSPSLPPVGSQDEGAG